MSRWFNNVNTLCYHHDHNGVYLIGYKQTGTINQSLNLDPNMDGKKVITPLLFRTHEQCHIGE